MFRRLDVGSKLGSMCGLCVNVFHAMRVTLWWRSGQGADSHGAADPDTKVWLEAHLDPVFGLPSLVRFSWSTAARLLEERAAAVRWYGTAGTAVGSILPEQPALGRLRPYQLAQGTKSLCLSAECRRCNLQHAWTAPCVLLSVSQRTQRLGLASSGGAAYKYCSLSHVSMTPLHHLPVTYEDRSFQPLQPSWQYNTACPPV